MSQEPRSSRTKELFESELRGLLREHYETVGAEIHKDRDCHWQIVERWSYGEPVGWFVEHNGYLYEPGEYGEAGPYPSQEEARRSLADHLRAAIADAREL
jgi:hypothetical protein